MQSLKLAVTGSTRMLLKATVPILLIVMAVTGGRPPVDLPSDDLKS